MMFAPAPFQPVTLQADAGAPAVIFAPPPRSALAADATTAAAASVTVTRVSSQAAPALPIAPPPPSPPQRSPPPPPPPAAPDTTGVAVAVPSRPLPSPGGIAPMALLKTTLAAASPLVPGDPAVAQPADGLWVLATAGCPLPSATDLNAWAECTQPLGFNGGELAVLEKPKGANKAAQTGGLFSIARTRYRQGALGPPSPQSLPGVPGPALVQVEVPGLTGRSYIYVAVKPEIVDGEGRFVAARAWPVACPPPATPNVSRRGDRCFASALQAVKDAASAQPGDGGYVLRWIDPTDAGIAGDTTGARTYAPPPAPVFQAPKKMTPLEAATPLPITDLPPDLAAQQPATPAYAPREEGDDSGPPVAKKPAVKKPPTRRK